MFKRLLRGIVLAATMSVPCMANAQNIDFIQDNLHYYIEGNSAAVSGDVDTVIDGSLIIPSHVSYDGITYIVTAILGFDYTGITSVSIPNTVTRIESGTFSHCTGLTTPNTYW